MKFFVPLGVAVLAVVLVMVTDVGDNFSLDNVQENARELRDCAHTHYAVAVLLFVLTYVITNLFIPTALVLTLLSGFLFGTIAGALYANMSAVVGGLLAFALSKHLAGDWIQRRWQRQLEIFNREVSRRGYVYLLMVRLTPMMPYILVNYIAGLTRIRVGTFIWTTALGSLPGILILSYAGQQLLTIKSVDDVFTPRVIVAMVLMAAFFGLVAVAGPLTKKMRTSKVSE